MKLSLLCWMLSGLTLALCAEPRLDDVSFDDPEDDPNELESTRYEPSGPEADTSYSESEPSGSERDRPRDGVHVALMAAMRRPGMQKKMGEIMPIIRVMSPPQRLTLAALLTSQMMSSSAPTLNEVSAMFGVEPSAPDDVKRRITSALLLPLSYDIARMLRGDRTERSQGRHRPDLAMLPSRRQSGDKERRSFARPPPGHNRRTSHVYAEMVPPPPPRNAQVDQADRRSDVGVDRMSDQSADRKSEECVLFSSTVCLEVPDYPGAQIAASLRTASDAMDDALLPESRDLELSVTENRRQDNNVATATMCESTTKMARPKKARTTSGQWKFIVNTGRHTQTLRLEVCTNPQGGCSYISDNFASECTQVYNYHRLLTWDETRGLHMDIFKVPTCCSCQVRGYASSFPPATSLGHTHPGHALDSHAFESHAPVRVAHAPAKGNQGDDAFLGNVQHGDGSFVLQGSPFQGAFGALPVDETELLKQGAVIEKQLLDRHRNRAGAVQDNQRRVQRRPGPPGKLPLGLVPPPGPPPTQPLEYEYVDNNIRRSRNQTHSDTRFQHVGVSRLPAIPLSRPSEHDVVRGVPIAAEPRPVAPPSPRPVVQATPTVATTTPLPRNRNAPQYEGEPVKVNYSYHPIIDFFKSRKIESRSGEGWTPIVGTSST